MDEDSKDDPIIIIAMAGSRWFAYVPHSVAASEDIRPALNGYFFDLAGEGKDHLPEGGYVLTVCPEMARASDLIVAIDDTITFSGGGLYPKEEKFGLPPRIIGQNRVRMGRKKFRRSGKRNK